MIRNTVSARGTSGAARDALAALGARVANDAAVQARVGLAVLARIKQAFVVKARGGTDAAGDRWAPLSPKTVAYSKTRQRGRGGRTKAEKKRPERPSQALTKKQQDRWWEVYRRALAQHRGDKRWAAAIAWFVLKREGAVTLLQKYGGRQVEILRDTGLLLNSLSPGSGSPEQVFRHERGAVVIGTNRKGAGAHHRGVPGRLPQRRLWPEPARWPQSWWDDVTDQVKQGAIDLTIAMIRGS